MRPTSWVLLVILTTMDFSAGELFENYQRLHFALLQNYDPLIPPISESGIPLNVSVGLTLLSFSMEEETSIASLTIWMNMKWNEPRFAWNSSEYGGISSIRVPPSRAWRPDLLAYNHVDSHDIDYMAETLLVVSDNGDILWVPPSTFKIKCRSEMMYWPEDTKSCGLKLGSWSYDGDAVDFLLDNDEVDISSFVSNEVWKLDERVHSVELRKNVVYYSCCPEPYVDITMTLRIKRLSFYYGHTIYMPAIVVLVISLLTFGLPTYSGNRFNLTLFSLTLIILAIVYLSEIIPKEGWGTPLIVKSYTMLFYVVLILLVMNVLIVNISTRTSQPPQRLLYWVTRWCGRILCLSKDNNDAFLIPDGTGQQELVFGKTTGWTIIASALNTFLFIVYIILGFFVVLTINF